MKCHAGKCNRKDYLPVEQILDVRGALGSKERQFLIRWKGFGTEHDSWQPRGNIYPGAINEFLKTNITTLEFNSEL